MAEAKRIINAKFIAVYVCLFFTAIFVFLKGQLDEAGYYEDYTSDYDNYTKVDILRITGEKYEEYLGKINGGEDIFSENGEDDFNNESNYNNESNFDNENTFESESLISVEKSIENSVLYEMKSQKEYMEKYKNKYTDMKSYANATASISIFNTEKGFSKRNVDKTIEDFNGIDNIELQYGNNVWVKALTEYYFADYLLLILIVFMIMQFGIEQKSNLIYFIRATKEGRGKLTAYRVILLTGFTAVSALAFYGGIFISSGLIHNVKYDFSRSIQSIDLFENCILKINIGQFLILFFVMKFLVIEFLALLMWNILGGVKEKKFGLTFLGIFFAAEFIMYSLIGSNSSINYFKYINIFFYLDTGSLIGGYKNLNLFSYPVNTFRIFTILVPAMIIILGAVCIYKNIYSYESSKKGIIRIKKIIEAARVKLSPVTDKTGIIRGEAVKLFVIMGGVAIAGIFIYIGYTRIDNKPLFKSQEGRIKEFYYDELEGEYSDDMIDRADKLIFEIDEEYTEIMESLPELSDEERIIMLMKAEGLQTKLSVLNGIRDNILYLKELKDEKGITGSLYNPDGVNYLFGNVSREPSLVNAIIICSFICIFSGGIYTYERKSNMLKFINSTLNGRGKTKLIKLLWCMLCSGIYAVIISITEYINVLGKVGIDGLSGLIQSTDSFRDFPFEISLSKFIVLVYFIRIICVISITSVVVCISKYMSKIITGQLTAMAVICIPLVLYYIGMDILKYVSLGRCIAVSDFMFNNGRWDNNVFVISAVIIAIGVLAAAIYMRSDTGYIKRKKHLTIK